MRELSIFVDESGDIGPYQSHSPYYIITMVLHDQAHDITHHLELLDHELSYLGFDNMAIHTEPLIRREAGELSKSEALIFHSKRDFYKDFIKRLKDKCL